MLLKSILIFLCFGWLTQSTYVLNNEAEFLVNGTSNLKDWHLSSNQGEGKASITYDDKLKAITSMEVIIPAESLTGTIPGIDPVVHKTLNSRKFPKIIFNLKEIKSITENGKQTVVIATGTLTVSGSSKLISLTVKSDGTGNVISFEGTTPMKFSDFNLTPPTAMFGAVKAANEMTVKFKVTFKNTVIKS
jgi:polyisoprenoid-binding protein YceI